MGSRDIQTFNGTAHAEHGADVPVFVASCVFAKPAREFASRHELCLIDITWTWTSAALATIAGCPPTLTDRATACL